LIHAAASLYRRRTSHFLFSSSRRHPSFSRDWSSDVCSSDLSYPIGQVKERLGCQQRFVFFGQRLLTFGSKHTGFRFDRILTADEIGRASCRERWTGGWLILR